jgi:cysteinyl-tRNA synthetase
MSTALLGTTFDLHGGGMDLKFPHHENEIAQSCAATGDHFANLWMHNGFVNIDDEKMSKSLGNFFTVREVLPGLRHPEVMRYFILSSHYRGPINYSLEQLEQADAALNRIYTALRDLPVVAATQTEYTQRFNEVMDDDLNTPEAFAVLQKMTREINTARDKGKPARAEQLGAELRALAGVLGLLQLDPAEWFRRSANPSSRPEGSAAAISDEEVERRIEARINARKAKDFAESDRIRDELAQAGVILEDKPGKTTWRRA